MSSIILQAHSLTKKYRHTVALDHIDLQIEKGKIYGFIGQNGAGKTTFLRLVTGLAFQTSGTLDLWGKSSAKDLQEQRKRIGCIHKLLHNLPEPYKEVFSLRVLGELSYQDIAKLFGKTESWARVTFHRAKLKIIEQVKEESYE